ncbi:MAG: sigma 54-interacting transcriptional regulator [Myxococcota bacterium]
MTPLLLEFWREVCKHLDIDESVRNLAPLLAAELPMDRLVIRRLDPERRRIETVATGGGELALPIRRDLAEHELSRVLSFCAAGRVRGWPAGQVDALRELIAPPRLDQALIAGPLLADGRPAGLVLVSAPSLPDSLERIQSMLEPLAVALANDARLHELARLREAVEADNRALLSRLQRQDISDSIVGAENGLRAVMGWVEQVAPTDAPVMILGETGSGKEVAARAIHARSRRADGPFLRVNCGAIPSELVDSELFGHERGSFTGAISTRKGWFERADGGTLFLDELAELPSAAQVRLLRVLQDGTFERVGGERTLTVDVRIIAATHRNMHDLVETGTFRRDLWYRLGVFPIHLPPLRERVGDIAALARHFASRAGLRLHGVEVVPTAEDIEVLRSYAWPGNVRELAAVIERAAILGDGRGLAIGTALGASGAAPPRTVATRADTLDTATRRHIEDALRRTRGRIEGPHGAARLLNVNPHTLRSRMRKLGIDWARYRDPNL